MSIKIIQIVPRLPPAIDGIGDYALQLACQLRHHFQIDTHFVVGDPRWQGNLEIEGFKISQVSQCSPEAIQYQLQSSTTTVLLHYVGYGYAQKGCPWWLIKGIRNWRQSYSQGKLITMFHEIAALGRPIWTSAFWLSGLQVFLAKSLVKISDCLVTSKQSYAQMLQELSNHSHDNIPHLPVFSTVGELQQFLPLVQRQRRAVIFGGWANRQRVYQQSSVQLTYACQRLNIEVIWDLGEVKGELPQQVEGIPLVSLGRLSVEEISDILADSFLGFFDYNPAFLGKSTIFAAYCAHGVLPVAAYGTKNTIDGINAGKHYWVANPSTKQLSWEQDWQGIANCAYAWYCTHDLFTQVKTFQSLLTQ